MKKLSTRDMQFRSQFDMLISVRQSDAQDVSAPVRKIINNVRARGDEAVIAYTAQFDGHELRADAIALTDQQRRDAIAQVPAALRDALVLAKERIISFHKRQMPQDILYTDEAGLELGLRWTPLDAVGLYVPGGKAAYPSSVLMNALPAWVAGVKRIAMCVPMPNGHLNPLVLAAADICGVQEIYGIGGAQAVAALAYGTKRIPPVDRIVGPGNAYVAEAKRQVFGHVGIDSIAGPSEVVIVADKENRPEIIAMDLLAQAEHDERAQAILITNDARFAADVEAAVAEALKTLPRRQIAGSSWADFGAIITVSDWDEAADLVNDIAPEHLEIMCADADGFSRKVRHAGAMFIGRHCPEAIGDYVGGPNHVLPTNRTARFASGLSVYDFLKRTTTIGAAQDGLKEIGPAAEILAQAEGLDAHAQSIALRLQK